MKKKIIVPLLCLLVLFCLSACSGLGLANPLGSTTTSSDVKPDPSAPDSGANQLRLDQSASMTELADEPPLQEGDLAIAAPDFLSEEQQMLYRRARFLYQSMFGGETTRIDELVSDDAPPRPDPDPYESVELDDYIYVLAKGRYSRWDDFDTVVHSVFTDAFWDYRNLRLGDNGTVPIYRDIDGRLGIVELSRGSGYYYNENFPDEFRLNSQTDSRIEFTLIGHYSLIWPREGETFEERDQRRAREYEYTLEFPIKMVLTENGWRFDEFHSALADEEERIVPVKPETSHINDNSTQAQTSDSDFETAINENGTITITRYIGPGGDVVIPSEINGKQVSAIGNIIGTRGAFEDCITVTSVVIPDGVTEIQDNAFYGCTALETATIPASVTLLRNCAFCDCPNLRAVYFEGNAPQQANYVFDSTENVTMYYRRGTSGWSNPWHGRPAETYAP